ncbi:peptidoglycan-binding domain-containing protein [Georgenia sp. Z1344]|uniref:peptidoglycan-binding domain-containing protein n=1 Tax=Georgenia sp. Z1344 TaxID=3416706 RepID=UPI003CFB7123
MVDLSEEARRRPRLVVIVLLATLCLAAGAVVGWALREVVAPASSDEEVEDHTVVEVVYGDVGSTLSLTASAWWPTTPLATPAATGTVTAVAADPGARVESGDVVIRVDERPVVVLDGAVPAYRLLAAGATGEDVRQLQVFLVRAGYLTGDPDGTYGPTTAAAVRAWQRELGTTVTGEVAEGSVMFVPGLPARVRAAEGIDVGVRLAGGESVLERFEDAPRIEVAIAGNQADLVSVGSTVVVDGPSSWSMVVDAVTEDEAGGLVAVLAAPDGGPACGTTCGEIPVEGFTTYPASVELVPSTPGPMVPAAALATRADGSYVVVDAGGTEVPVDVLAQGSGYAVVDGIEPGAEVRVPG